MLLLSFLYGAHTLPPYVVSPQMLKELKVSANAGNREAQFKCGLYYDEKGPSPNIQTALHWYRQASNQGLPEAQNKLGQYYQKGFVGEKSLKNLKKALALYDAAGEQGLAEAWNNRGLCFRDEAILQDHREAAFWFKKAADQGNAAGRYNYAMSLFPEYLRLCQYPEQYGNALDLKLKDIVELLDQAAMQGYPDAQSKLEEMCRNQQIKSEKPLWLTKQRAEQGHLEDQFKLGEYYENRKNVQQAFKWFKTAADQGHAEAQCSTGINYINGTGTEKNEKEAIVYLKKSVQQEYAHAFYVLGFCYQNGRGVDQNHQEAVQNFKQGADRKSSAAQYRLALYLERGQEVAQSYEEARKYFELAAINGNKDAQYKLACYLENGVGGPKDTGKAKAYFLEAAKRGHSEAKCTYMLRSALDRGYGDTQFITTDTSGQEHAVFQHLAKEKEGNREAMYNLGICCAHGNGVAKNMAQALKWYHKAAEDHYRQPAHTGAQYELGLCYEKGEDGVPKDLAKAFEYVRKAAEGGLKEAQYTLGWYHSQGYGKDYRYGGTPKEDWNEAIAWWKKAADQGHVLAKEKIDILMKRD